MTKRISINVENDEVVSVEINGLEYDASDQIPDPDERAKVQRFITKLTDDDEHKGIGRNTSTIFSVFLA